MTRSRFPNLPRIGVPTSARPEEVHAPQIEDPDGLFDQRLKRVRLGHASP